MAGGESVTSWPSGKLLVLADRLIDGINDTPATGAAVLIDKGRIVTVGDRQQIGRPSDVASIDLGPRTLLPGMIDSHVHLFGIDTSGAGEAFFTQSDAYRALFAARDARRLLAAGFTTVGCLGSTVSPHLARASRERLVPSPRVVAAGWWICPTEGTWDVFDVPLERLKAEGMIADGVDEVRSLIRRKIREGAGIIKIGTSVGGRPQESALGHAWGDPPHNQVPCFTSEEIRAMVEEAHRRNLKVAAHAIGDDPVRHAVAGGVDVVQHGHAIGDDTREMLADRGVILVPTLSHSHVLVKNGRRVGLPNSSVEIARRHLEVQREDFRKALAAGIKIANGSDLTGPPLAPHGENGHELVLMVAEGMSEMDALKAATATAADAIGLADSVGTVEEGKSADLIALDGNPLEDIEHVLNVPFVIQEGVVVKAEGIDGVTASPPWI